MTVDAIKDKKKVGALIANLKWKNERDWFLVKYQ